MIHPERIQELNAKDIARGRYVLYWMQQSQRAEYNHALEYAIERANEIDQPLVVAFGLMDDYPEANLRHCAFMLEGLRETQSALEKRDVQMVVVHGHPADVALSLGKDASAIVCDRGYLKHQKEWRYRVADEARCQVVQIESDVIVPVEAVSNKAEYAARTIRPKIHRRLNDFLVEIKLRQLSAA
ncbi:MAG: deoxyribodipyrimidine photo-lyase [Burkholderiales bacterium]